MKILIITPRIPYPPYRGDKLKVFNISKELLKRNEVKILSFMCTERESKDLEELRDRGFEIEIVKLPRLRSWLNMMAAFISRRPLQVLYYSSNKMHSRIKELTSNEKFDVIYFHLINSAQYHSSVDNSNSLKVLDFTDASSLYLKRYVQFLTDPFRKLVFYLEAKRVTEYEKIAMKFDTLFVCSNADKEYLLCNGVNANIHLLLNGVDLELFKYKKSTQEAARIIFAGNMSYFPNIDAVEYFVNEIFPIVQKKVPSAKFYIVGQQPPQKVLDLQSDSIIVTGFVSDIRKEYLASMVNIAPIRFGSGTLNKVIESLLLGVPTVATKLAIIGSPDEIKKFIYIADTPEQFASKVVQLISDRQDWETRRLEAISTVRSLLGWERIVEKLETYLSERRSDRNIS